MIRKTIEKTMYHAICIGCMKLHGDEQGALLWDDRHAAVQAALDDDWQEHNDALYCPVCIEKELHIPRRKRTRKNENKSI